MKQREWMHWEDTMPYPEKISPDFYQSSDVILLARALLGKVLVTQFGERYTSGIISETEAYAGISDKASHAYGGKKTNRTQVMFLEGGISYVYLCYGLHSLFNVVTGKPEEPHAILIRGIIPCEGISTMEERRQKKHTAPGFSSGPGTVSLALGIHYSASGTSLQSDSIWLEDRGIRPEEQEIRATPRIGVDYAGEDATLPYRFVWTPPSTFAVHSFRQP